MDKIQYIGEWLLPGNIGHFLTLLSMVGALYATICFGLATWWEDTNSTLAASWKRMGRIGFALNGLAVVGIFATLFFLIFEHRFEYKYVWQHSSRTLPVYYMISCFWEGQEGSFLLWQFWTAVLGMVLIGTARKWEASTMTVVGAMQVFLATMLIGIYIGSYKLGSSPFILTRLDMGAAPIFQNPNYLELFLKDGRGLNPLLQNYWMVIHPPTLFLGFALTLIPFAYTMAALWKRDFTDWVRPTLSWALLGGGILGGGILMGGAWAYEALSFGGFWAWDPVENASLVPWLTLVAGIHTLLAYKHSGYGLRGTAVFFTFTLWLILYSTFLTRSGVLGDSSVHSFTDLGMSGQLLAFMWFFIVSATILIIARWKSMPSPQKDESAYSREFWMFIGALLLTMVAGLIAIDTSWPVINKVFGTNKAITDPIPHYNRYTLWFAVVVGMLSATIQYFRYKDSDIAKFLRSLIVSTAVSVLLTALIAYLLQMSSIALLALLFAGVYGTVANLNYLITVIKGKIKVAGASVAHIGFGILLIGILISSAKKEIISLNTTGIDYGKEFDEKNKKENILLYKNKPMQMGDYFATYKGDSIEGINTYYKVLYEKKKALEDTPSESFMLYPHVQINPNMGMIANPATRHYLTKDIFTHITSAPDNTQSNSKSQDLKEGELAIGDTLITKNSFIILKAINATPIVSDYVPMPGDIAVGAKLQVINVDNINYDVEPIYYIRNSTENRVDTEIKDLGLTIKFDKIITDKNKIKLSVIETAVADQFIILKAELFPYINLVWLGSIVMVTGFLMSVHRRRKEGVKPKKNVVTTN